MKGPIYRSRWQAIGLAIVGVLSTAFFLNAALDPTYKRVFSAAFSVFLAVASLAIFGRLARSGIRFNDTEIEILNPIRTIRIPPGEVKRFAIERYGLAPRVACAEKTDGTKLPVWGIAAPNPVLFPDGRSAELIDQLNGLLSEAKRRAS